MELYAHVDWSLLELIRSRLSQLFHSSVRGVVAPRGPQAEPSKGLLDGKEAVTARLQEANKADELIAKVGFFSSFSHYLILSFSSEHHEAETSPAALF